MFLHMKNSKNMSKLSFVFHLLVKTGAETSTGTMTFWKLFDFLVFTIYNHNSLCKKFHLVSICSL